MDLMILIMITWYGLYNTFNCLFTMESSNDDWIVLNMTGFVLNMTGLVLDITESVREGYN